MEKQRRQAANRLKNNKRLNVKPPAGERPAALSAGDDLAARIDRDYLRLCSSWQMAEQAARQRFLASLGIVELLPLQRRVAHIRTFMDAYGVGFDELRAAAE